ncbi:MAG: DUF4402 domain-containing protein [Pseudomonadota bacterium]
MVYRHAFSSFTRWPLRIAAGALALALPSVVSAQEQVSSPASAAINPGLQITKVRDLDYGRVIVPRNGRIDMTADNASTCTPNNGLLLLAPCQSAQFEGQAVTGLQLRISVPVGRRTTLTGPDRELRLRRIAVGPGNGVSFQGRTNRHFDFVVTDPAGEFDFFVAGRLLFRNNQAPGVYTGTFTIEAAYQ